MLKEKSFNLIIVSLLALVFFLATAGFNYYSQSKNYVKWSSPDETANYFFTREFSRSGQLAFFDAANIIGDNIVIPRSVRSDEGWIKPVSFLGIILIYGRLAALFGIGVIPFLTPLFAALGLLLFYLIVRRLFSDRVALWSAFLLATFPVYIYYTVRSMFHNILFIVLLLAAAYLSSLAFGSRAPASEPKPIFLSWSLPVARYWEFLAIFSGGLFSGLALITRTSELLWLGPVLLIIFLFYGRRLGLTKSVLFLAGLVLGLLPAAYYNQIIYNSFWHGGYNEMNRSLSDIAQSGGAIWQSTWLGQFNHYRHYLGQIFRQIFYFGFNYQQSLLAFRHYVYEMFPAIFYGGLFGLLLLIGQNIRRFQKKHLVYILTWLLASAILVFYYGSWKFNDNPDLTQFTIGNSYTRYWLPLYLGLIPLAALALVRLSRAVLLLEAKTQRVRRIIALGLQAFVVLLISVFSLSFVLFGSAEGLAYLYSNNQIEKINTEQVWSLTEPSAIIITHYYDKFFWPERRVIMGALPDNQIMIESAKLLKYYPIYYYDFYLGPAAVDYLNSRKLAPFGLHLSLIKKLNLRFGLYRLTLIINPAAHVLPTK